jgi:polyisoprenoid-binding protein YceI
MLMTVLDPGLSPDKSAEVQARMRGPEVLDSGRYPDIRFASTRVTPDGADRWQVTGDLSLHGASRPLTFVVVRRDGRFRGTVSIRQRDFGIQPISIVGGTVKVKDQVQIDFDIVD